MPVERCDECGFDSETWTDETAMAAIEELPVRWADAVSGLSTREVGRRPIDEMWSIAEYVDHVREVLFGMRFVLDSAVADPGVELGEAPEPRFDPSPRAIDVQRALAGLAREARALHERLDALTAGEWSATAIAGGTQVDGHWVARHAVHDATHHLLDVERLRAAL